MQRHILVIDDNESVRVAVKRMIERTRLEIFGHISKSMRSEKPSRNYHRHAIIAATPSVKAPWRRVRAGRVRASYARHVKSPRISRSTGLR